MSLVLSRLSKMSSNDKIFTLDDLLYYTKLATTLHCDEIISMQILLPSPQSMSSPPPPHLCLRLSLTHVDTGTAYTTASSTTTGLTRPKSNCASWSGCSSRPTASTFWSLASTPRPSARARAPQPWGWCRRLARTCSARPSPACGSPARAPPLA